MSDTGLPAAGSPEAAAAAAAAAAAGAKPWYDGVVTGEDLGHFQNRGYDKMTPAQAALAASKAHREAEKHLGVPADQLLRMPKDAADAEGWARVNARFGVPATAAEYDFSSVKFADGSALDAPFVEALAPALIAANVPKDKAAEIAKAVAGFLDKSEAADAAENTSKLAADREALKINWGSNVEANMLVAKQAAAALNVTPEQIAALEKVVGYSKVMEMFRNIGTKIGEDTFVTNKAPGGSGVMSAEQAEATLAEKQADGAWVTKLNAGDVTTVKEFHNLTTLVSQYRTAKRNAA